MDTTPFHRLPQTSKLTVSGKVWSPSSRRTAACIAFHCARLSCDGSSAAGRVAMREQVVALFQKTMCSPLHTLPGRSAVRISEQPVSPCSTKSACYRMMLDKETPRRRKTTAALRQIVTCPPPSMTASATATCTNINRLGVFTLWQPQGCAAVQAAQAVVVRPRVEVGQLPGPSSHPHTAAASLH